MPAHAPHARLTYLGPEGTFTEAALRTLPEAATHELFPSMSVAAALDAVRNEDAAAALVPIENSVEGAVTATLDELATGRPLVIRREVLLPISFALLVRPGTTLDDVKTVTGHSVAQAQVRRWLAANLPHAEWESAASNAEGARLVRDGRFDCCFAGEFTARRYGLEALLTNVNDAADATTRFVLLGRPGPTTAPTRADKTSIVVWPTEDEPGALLALLQEWAVRKVNLIRIESRPTGEGLGRYCFSIDAEGHVSGRGVSEALMGLHRICRKIRFLGSYPRADRPAPPAGQRLTGHDFVEAADWLSTCLTGDDGDWEP
ncbi:MULTISPECIES: prephenate dehydratase [unclassified Parafrankia]|uniref:prephenate dehydratase n=1 Tax=Parafrankia TaxID=2994362 RepID=UPI000DA43829|nr:MULTISPECIES: prephenate dehydratase [unclassified Parafrankia]TCJ35787.1 prephenate dehydratase [Parafrankia sp. BMG5.11]CAI7978141.1 Prephenate dehydratase [Frankia sp. Hr75.2]SQD98461.1 Prephenate dehydratase [Parafrankia sp. Ea1.12]